jgi:hypothetical protein
MKLLYFPRNNYCLLKSVIIIIIIGSTALCGPWPSSVASASLLYPSLKSVTSTKYFYFVTTTYLPSIVSTSFQS